MDDGALEQVELVVAARRHDVHDRGESEADKREDTRTGVIASLNDGTRIWRAILRQRPDLLGVRGEISAAVKK
jgi:hypothetical protein